MCFRRTRGSRSDSGRLRDTRTTAQAVDGLDGWCVRTRSRRMQFLKAYIQLMCSEEKYSGIFSEGEDSNKFLLFFVGNSVEVSL